MIKNIPPIKNFMFTMKEEEVIMNRSSLPELSPQSDFITMKAEAFFQKYKFDKQYYENLRIVMDMYAMNDSNSTVPSVSGGYWRRMIEGISYDDFDADIDFFYTYIRNNKTKTVGSSRPSFCSFLYNNFTDPDFDTEFVSNLNPEKNINITLTDFFGKIQQVQVMGFYFSSISNIDHKDAVINGIKTMDSFVNMIGYDFYSDSFVFHKDTMALIKKRHYKVNTFGIKSNRAFSIGLIKRIVKFTQMGYYLDDDDYDKANKHIQECKDAVDHYNTETVDFHDIGKSGVDISDLFP